MRGQGLAFAAHRSSLPRDRPDSMALGTHTQPDASAGTACALPPCKSHHRITLKAPRLTLMGFKHHSFRVWTQSACQPADVPDKHPVFRGNHVKLLGKRQKEISTEGRDPQLRWLCLRHPRCSRRACGVSRGWSRDAPGHVIASIFSFVKTRSFLTRLSQADAVQKHLQTPGC